MKQSYKSTLFILMWILSTISHLKSYNLSRVDSFYMPIRIEHQPKEMNSENFK